MTPKRYPIFKLVMILIGLILLGRLFFLQVISHQFFKSRSNDQLKRIIRLYPNRGNIYDRNQRPLALIEPKVAVFAVPNEIKNKWVFAKMVAPLLNTPRKVLSDELYNTKAPFIWLSRKSSIQTYDKLKELNLKGMGFIKTEQRYYPQNTLAAHSLGFVGVDNQGLSGLEFKFDKSLKGSQGKIILEGDPSGFQLLSGRRETIPPYDGKHIITTLDEYIQYSAEKHLKTGIDKYNAERGQVIVMDPKTGGILAMACHPTFNANTWTESKSMTRKNAAIVDVYEPGSVFKIITLAAFLDAKLGSPQTIITVPETLPFYGRTIHESHDREEGETDKKSISEIIQKSLNVGTSLMAVKLKKERFYNYMTDFGFGHRSNIELPGESKGLLREPKQWSKVDIATMSFGQGVAVTPLQMTTAIAAIANDGMLMRPRIISYITDHNFQTRVASPITPVRQVVTPKTARMVSKILTEVVNQGTGITVRIPGYSIAGKTGTAQKAKTNGLGYEDGKYIASFGGFFPSDEPEVVIMVIVDSPQRVIWGSQVAGPIFKNIAKDIIDYRHILPDELRKEKQASL